MGILRAGLLLLLFPAARASAADPGYVVKVEGPNVYLDLTQAGGASVGQEFTIFSEGAMLKHPVTGAELGRVEKTIASGRLTEVRETYSVGEVAAGTQGLAAGQKARLKAVPAPPAGPAPRPEGSPALSDRGPYFRSPVLPLDAVDLALGDVDGDGDPDAVLAGKETVEAFAIRLGSQAWAPLCRFEDRSTSPRFLSIESQDADGDGRAEVFVTLHNKFFGRVESYVLDCRDGVFTRRASLPWMVRSYAAAEGGPRLAAQQLIDDGSFPLSNIYDLAYKDGKHLPSEARIKHKRLDWLYGFSLSRVDARPTVLSYNHAGRLRLQFEKGAWTSREAYGQTANRIRWREKELHFSPRLVMDSGAEGLAGAYVLKNIPRLTSLSESFGLYSHGELRYLRFNDIGLEPAWTAELPGYVAGLAARYGSDGRPQELLTAVVAGGGGTSVWFFRPDGLPTPPAR